MDISTKIVVPKSTDLCSLTELARKTFIESHGHSSPEKYINNYSNRYFAETVFEKELAHPQNIFRLLYQREVLAGYSKITLNHPHNDIRESAVTKLDRLYFLEEFLGLGLAKKLLDFNIDLAKKNHQKGIWLFVWTENTRAINFYTKQGFKIIGKHYFFVTPTYSNPNHIMFLEFE